MYEILVILCLVLGPAVLNQALFTWIYYKTPLDKRDKYEETFELMWGGLAPRH